MQRPMSTEPNTKSDVGLEQIEKDLEKIKAQLIISEKDKVAQSIKTDGTSENLSNWKRAGDDLIAMADAE
jgi:hypothetical protein